MPSASCGARMSRASRPLGSASRWPWPGNTWDWPRSPISSPWARRWSMSDASPGKRGLGGLTARIAALALTACVIVGPLLSLVVWSLAERWTYPAAWPQRLGFRYWSRMLTADFLDPLKTGLGIAAVVTMAALLCAVPLGYALARLRFPGRTLVLLVFLYSLDEFTGTLLVGAPFVTTLPVYMYTASQGYEMQIASVTALVLMAPGVILLLLLERVLRAEYLTFFGQL